MTKHNLRIVTAVVLGVTLFAGAVVAMNGIDRRDRLHLVAYFDNSNGLFTGDEVRVLGVPVGEVTSIEAQPERVKITFWVDGSQPIPADANAVIVSPQLVTARAIQLTPAYSAGPKMHDGAVIPQDRTAVPLEWDDLRLQLEKLAEALKPTEPGAVSTLGAFINTAADNLSGEGADIRDTVTKLSAALSVLGDHSDDIFTTAKNLSVVVSALEDSSALLRQLNHNMAFVTGLLAESPDAVADSIADLRNVVADATHFIADTREAMGAATDNLAAISTAVQDSIDDVEQTLHIAPTAFQNFVNVYQPTQNALSGALALNNLADPITFLCGAIQAASRLNGEHSAKLCVQYLAPIVKNRQYNFPPLGANFVVGQAARPNEITYSEDWMRPDYRPPQRVRTDPEAGLPGMMLEPGGGS